MTSSRTSSSPCTPPSSRRTTCSCCRTSAAASGPKVTSASSPARPPTRQDTLDWISAQEWSNGKVGLHGCSSTAENQLKLGAIGHPALRACVPMSSGAGIGDIPGAEGSKRLLLPRRRPDDQDVGAVARAIRRPAAAEAARQRRGRRTRPHLPAVLGQRAGLPGPRRTPRRSTEATLQAPSGEVLRRMGSPLTGLRDVHRRRPGRPGLGRVDLIDASHTGATPSINVNGWMDVGAYETVKLFEFQQHHPDQYLIMAPTGHCQMRPPSRRAARRPAGRRHPVPLRRDPHLLVRPAPAAMTPSAWQPMPKVQVFLMGAGTWLTGEAWPLPDTEDAAAVPDQRRGRQHPLGRRRAGCRARPGRAPTSSSPTRTTRSTRIGGDLAPTARSAPTSGRSSAGPTCSSTARPC